MKHTPEPWKADGTVIYADIGIQPHVAYTEDLTDTPEENAQRIVACVNACAGIEDPAFEIDSLRKDIKAMDLNAEHDELIIGELEEELAKHKADSDRLAGLLVKHLADNPKDSTYNCVCDLCTETRAALAAHEEVDK